MLSLCMILGIAPLVPKRKNSYVVEIKIEETESDEKTGSMINFEYSDCHQ
jgi:hypothetical protein